MERPVPVPRTGAGGPEVLIGTLLAAASGAVDVLAFTRLGEAFASVITGNLVVVGVALADGDLSLLSRVGVAVLAYAAGVGLSAYAVRRSDPVTVRWPIHATILVLVELGLMMIIVAVWVRTGGSPHAGWQYLALTTAAVAMGVQSVAFRSAGVPAVTTTYFTGTLTSLVVGLVTGGQVNRPALLALLALVIGAVVAGWVVARAPAYAVGVPVLLLVGALTTIAARRRVLAEPRTG